MEPLLILQGVRQVSEIALPLEPRRASQRAFDEARPHSDFPDLPAARNIVRSLEIGWADVLALAHQPESTHAQGLGRKRVHATGDYLTTEYVEFALRLVALRLGKHTLSLSDYSTERAAMLKHDRASWLHGGQLILPEEYQVITVMGSWEKALASADLAASVAERRVANREIKRAPTVPDLLERFYSHYHVQATSTDLQTFARANGIQHPNMRGITFGQALVEWKEWRTRQGLRVPSAPPPLSERADYSRDVGAARPGETRREKLHPLEECIAWMRRYLEGLPASAHSTRSSYRDWARQHGAPAPAVLDRKHGGFSRVRRLAQERMRAERSSRSTSPMP